MGKRYPHFERVKNLLGNNSEKAAMWFRTDNPMLGGVSPDWMLENGREMRLRKFIDEAELSSKFPIDTIPHKLRS